MNHTLQPTFDALKALVEPYAEFMDVTNTPDFYNLDSYTRDENGNRMLFAAVRLGESDVSYCLAAPGLRSEIFARLSPALEQYLQSDACFHFTHLDPARLDDLQALTQQGFEVYRQAGWANPPLDASAASI